MPCVECLFPLLVRRLEVLLPGALVLHFCIIHKIGGHSCNVLSSFTDQPLLAQGLGYISKFRVQEPKVGGWVSREMCSSACTISPFPHKAWGTFQA